MTQSSFFVGQPDIKAIKVRIRKRVRDTSIEAWLEILGSISVRERDILSALESYFRRNGYWPTAYELYFHIKDNESEIKPFDVNSVRPVLTAMKDLGMVEFTDKRICSISKKKVYTWRFPEPAQQHLFKEITDVTN